MMLRRLILAAAILVITASPVLAKSGVAVGGKLGTLGAQAEVQVGLTELLTLRGNIGYLGWTYDTTVDEIDYDFDIHLPTLGAILDVHPFLNGFRISGGIIFNGNDFSGSGTPAPEKTFKIGDHNYSGLMLGRLDADTDFNKVAPYVGIGYDGAFTHESNWSFNCELGVMYWGDADVSLKANSPITVPGLEADLRKEEQDLEDELNRFRVYPVLTLGLTYRF